MQNNPINNKRKVLCGENLDDESTAVKIPKLSMFLLIIYIDFNN